MEENMINSERPYSRCGSEASSDKQELDESGQGSKTVAAAIKTFQNLAETMDHYIKENRTVMERASRQERESTELLTTVKKIDASVEEIKNKMSTPEPQESDKLKQLTMAKESRGLDASGNKELIKIMLKNHVKAQREFLLNKLDPKALMAEIDDFGNTIFHYIVQGPDNKETSQLLRDVLAKVPEGDRINTLRTQNINRLTALHNAACAGNTGALKVFAEDNRKWLLGTMDGKIDLWLPIHHAALWGRRETVEYLLSETSNYEIVRYDYAMLLDLLVGSNLYGLALDLLKKRPHLASPDSNPRFWKETMKRLARKPLAFESGSKLGYWKRLIYSIIPVNDYDREKEVKDDQAHAASSRPANDVEGQTAAKTPNLQQIAAKIGGLGQNLYAHLWNLLIQRVQFIKRIRDQKQMYFQTPKIVRKMISEETWTYNKAANNLKEAVLTAARLGIHEFVDEVLKAYPNSVLFNDKEERNIFLLAVLHRKDKVFNLIHDQIASVRDQTNYIDDKYEHNILHIAGLMLAPSKEVSGAALQMQRELQWFEEIKEQFQPWLQEQQNTDGLIPAELFTKKHGDLIKEGKEWMKDTATSCSVVGALIITIVFAAAFTVPGGLEENGVPIFLNNIYFRTFAVSVPLALFASTASVQTFLGMLTSRYAEDDFLKALPSKLIIGLVTLFLSNTSMMVAFGAAFCIVLSHPWKWAIILICLLGCLPVTLYVWMQFPLLAEIVRSTYGPSFIKTKKNA